MAYGTREVSINCANYTDGLNTGMKPTDVGKAYRGRYPKYWCVDCLNAMLHTNLRRPSITGIVKATGRTTGLHNYLRHDSTQYLLEYRGTKLYRVSKTDGTATELLDVGSTGEAWFEDWSDRAWLCVSGVGLYKVEGTAAYRVGIVAPTAGIAAIAAGGTLAPGAYKVYVSYARKVNGTNVLYSQGYYAGEVTASGGNQSVTISGIPNSTDAQVNNKVIWMTNAAGTVYYYYGETGDNATTSITISSATNKNEALVYTTQAAYNYVPGAATSMHIHGGRVWYSIGPAAYYSIQAGTAYDLERFDTRSTGRIITYPYNINAMFTLGADLYFDTDGGIIKQPNGDPFAQYEIVTRLTQEHFSYPRTIVTYAGVAIGLTRNGVRMFDGEKMHPVDLSQHVKPDIGRIFSGYGENTRPCAAMYRRTDRAEYHLAYLDPQVGASINNRRLVMNLDQLGRVFEGGEPPAWEKHDTGANYMTVDASGIMYCVQAAAESVLYNESTSAVQDSVRYVADTYHATYVPQYKLRSPSFLVDLRGKVRWSMVRVLADFLQTFSVRVQLIESSTANAVDNVSPANSGGFVLDLSVLDTDALGDPTTTVRRIALPMNRRGVGMYVEILQSGASGVGDKTMRLVDLEVFGTLFRSVFT